MWVELINDNKKEILFEDIFDKKDLFATSIEELEKKIKTEVWLIQKELDIVIENQKRLWRYNLSIDGITKIKDLIDFDNLEQTLWYATNNEFIDIEELKKIKNDKVLEKGVDSFNQQLKEQLNLCNFLWDHESNTFDLESCKKIDSDYIPLKQFFIIDKKTKASIYDMDELASMYFNEIYGVLENWKGLYNFQPSKLLILSYSFTKKQFLLEIIDNHGHIKDNLIIVDNTEMLKFWYMYSGDDCSFKQLLFDWKNIDNQLDLKELLTLSDEEIIIEDKNIIDKNNTYRGFLGYSYSISIYESILKLNNAVDLFINWGGIASLNFNLDDVIRIETSFYWKMEELKKDIKKNINLLNINKKDTINITSTAEIEWLYDSKNYLNVRDNNIDYNKLYDVIIKQVIIHYIIFTIKSKIWNIIDFINKDEFSIYEFWIDLNNLEILIEIKQGDKTQKLKIKL